MVSRAPTRKAISPLATSLMWITIDPVDDPEDAAGSSGAAAFGDWRMAAEADKPGSRVKVAAVTVAAVTVVPCKNERRVFFSTVLSLPVELVFTRAINLLRFFQPAAAV